MTVITLYKKECPYCDKLYKSFQKCRLHIFQAHNKQVAPRQRKDHCFDARTYNPNNREKYPDAQIKYACTSCVDCFGTKEEFAQHVDGMHLV